MGCSAPLSFYTKQLILADRKIWEHPPYPFEPHLGNKKVSKEVVSREKGSANHFLEAFILVPSGNPPSWLLPKS
jgi:hypothetical protein